MLKNAVSIAGQRGPSISERLFRIFIPEKIEKHPWDESQRDVFLEDLEISENWIGDFPEPPDFFSKRVAEIGCGFGALCVQAALGGAEKVLGVELDMPGAITADQVVGKENPELTDIIDFTDYAAIKSGRYDGRFDIVLSQNSFEHYEDPESVLNNMVTLLKPGGYIYAGFGPLWFSPYGSHLKAICSLPWAHLWAEDMLLTEHNRLRPHDPRKSWKDFGLNMAPFSYYREIFYQLDGCRVIHFCHNRPFLKRSQIGFLLLEMFRIIPFLRNYLTSSLFVVLKKEISN
jgi:SAM-dependent methyltransferase